ncbi:MAG: hypothetical protein JXQ29_09070 [Planctomycetes bacterium]|nr:hypothetical protein [Planctomycetota bacterium]
MPVAVDLARFASCACSARSGGGQSHAGGPEGSAPIEDEAAGSWTPRILEDLRIPEGLPLEGPARILVVGACEAVRAETVDLLRRDGDPGWEADAVGEAGAARTKLMLEPWDLLLLRLDGGPLDYREVFRARRMSPRFPLLPVVVVITPDPELAADLGALTASAVLPAPVAPERLLDAIRAELGSGGERTGPYWETSSDASGSRGDEPPA